MSWEHSFHRIVSGEATGLGPASVRAALSLVEPFYAAAARARNRAFDRDPLKARHLTRPVVSIGNLTAGGTGKTPVVRWLASRLRDEGRRVAVLSRGYKASPGSLGDEQRMLDALLNGPDKSPVVIRADPDRYAAGVAALHEHPEIDVFLLDDGYQHRPLGRDLDLVLINATEPFGYGHVLPRGLLREPIAGLSRADAVILTHASAVDEATRAGIIEQLRRHAADAPVYQCDHAPARLRMAATDGADLPTGELKVRRVFAFCGIGSPRSFERQVRSLAGTLTGGRWFPDHHHYTPADLATLRRAARDAGADVMVTTEKDWVKLAPLDTGRAAGDDALPIWRLDVEAQFRGADAERLLGQVMDLLDPDRRGGQEVVG